METKNILRPYIIWAPPYHKSNGIRALYRLYDELKLRGFEVYIWCTKPQYKDGYEYIHKISAQMRKNAIAVYPEVTNGNPLKMQNVVRWVLYYPGRIGRLTEFDKNELIFSWLKEYFDAPILQVPHLDRKLFYKDENVIKDTDAYFVYKGGQCRDLPELQNAVKITYNSPASREELAKLLRRTKVLYSFDDKSALNDEALLCGAKVMIVKADQIIAHTDIEEVSPADFSAQLDNFINLTQKYYAEKTPFYRRKFKLFGVESAKNHAIYYIFGLKLKIKK